MLYIYSSLCVAGKPYLSAPGSGLVIAFKCGSSGPELRVVFYAYVGKSKSTEAAQIGVEEAVVAVSVYFFYDSFIDPASNGAWYIHVLLFKGVIVVGLCSFSWS